MVDIPSLLKSIINNSGLEQDKFGETIGLKKAAFNNYVQGRRELPKSVISKLMEVHNINPAVFFDKDATMYIRDLAKQKYTQQQDEVKHYYSYYPYSVSAGIPLVAEPVTEYNVDEISIPDTLMGKWAGSKEIFVMRINGDSMNNIMPDRSIIAVKPVELSALKDNDIVVFSNDNEYSVKRIFFDKENSRIIFRPDSTDRRFTDYVIDCSKVTDLKIHGKVVLYIVELD